jgi:hypothetical protein
MRGSKIIAQAKQLPNINDALTSNIFSRGRNMLQILAITNFYEAVCDACELDGIDVNANTPNANWTAVHFAIQSTHPESYLIVYKLLECGAKLNIAYANTQIQRHNVRAWIDAQQRAIEKCKRACLIVLWAQEYYSRSIKEPFIMIARMVLETQLQRYWYS